jgi:hypothetical protein
VAPKGQISTYSFFPAIDTSINQRGFRPRPGENKMSVPSGEPNSLAAGSLGGSTTNRMGAYFPGVSFTGLIPPDCHAATGTTHVVQTVNSRIAFYNKTTGVATFNQDSTTFFSGIGAGAFQFDPRVIYDQYNDRFILIFLAQDDASELSQILIAASDDGDPNGTWNRFILDSAVDIGGQNSWLDYPMVGYTADAFVVAGNMFPFGGGGFTGIQAYVIDSGDLYSNTGVTATPFTVTGQGFNLQPADTYTPGTTTVYGVSLNTTTSLRVWAFTDVDTAPALTSTTLAVPLFANIGAAPSGASAGAMDTISGRTMDAASRDEFMVAAHTVGVGGRAAVRWYEVDFGTWPTAGTPTLAQSGDISLPAGQWAFMPAISKNSAGAISVLYTRSSSSIVSDLVVSSRLAADAPGVMGPPTLLRSGVNPNAGGRWGDYFSVTVDPTDDLTFWGHGEVTRNDGLWATEMVSWQATSPGVEIEYDPTGVSTFYGAGIGGGLAQVLTSDDAYFNVQSAEIPGLGYFAGVEANFVVAEAPGDVLKLKFAIEAHATLSASVTATLYLWDWNTSQFVYANAFVITSTDTSGNATLSTNIARFIGPGGQVRAALRGHDPWRKAGNRPQPFVFGVDYMHLTITASP